MTNYPALPKGTRQVEVVFGGLNPMNVMVTPASDATINTAGPVPTKPKFWGLRRNNPRLGWTDRRVADTRAHQSPARGYSATVDLIR